MLFKIFLQAFTLYLFLGGYFLTFIIMILQESPILNSFWISFIGGFTLSCIWGFCIKLLTFLFSNKELSSLFGVPLPEGTADAFNEENDEDDLTLTDLYNPDDGDLREDELTPITDTNSVIRLDHFTPPERDNDNDSEASTSGRLDVNGKFDLTAGGKTLKASPQDGAQAIRKTLHDSKNE